MDQFGQTSEDFEAEVIESGAAFTGALGGLALGAAAPALVGLATPIFICFGVFACVKGISIPFYLAHKIQEKVTQK